MMISSGSLVSSEGPAVAKWEKPIERADAIKQPFIHDIEEKLAKQVRLLEGVFTCHDLGTLR